MRNPIVISLGSIRLTLACLFGIVGSLTCGRPADGAEVILFQLQAAEVKIYRQDFEAMAQTGAVPDDIKAILGEDFQIPQDVRQLLLNPIQLPASTHQFLESDTGEFLLERLDHLISSTTGQQTENLKFLRSAITEAAEQQQTSFLDLVRQYPQKTVKVNLTGIEQTYQQVIQFIDDIQSESNPTRQFLANLLCNCPPAQRDKGDPTSTRECPSPALTKIPTGIRENHDAERRF